MIWAKFTCSAIYVMKYWFRIRINFSYCLLEISVSSSSLSESFCLLALGLCFVIFLLLISDDAKLNSISIVKPMSKSNFVVSIHMFIRSASCSWIVLLAQVKMTSWNKRSNSLIGFEWHRGSSIAKYF